MKTKTDEIHDMIQLCPTSSREPAITEILNILEKLNKRINNLESGLQRSADIASCLANGIQPD